MYPRVPGTRARVGRTCIMYPGIPGTRASVG